MKNQETHIGQQHSDFFKKVEIPFEQDKNELWNKLEEKITENTSASKTKTIKLITLSRVAAAVVVLLVSSALFLMFNSTNITCPKGQHISHTLPDGSVVNMNADSWLRYYPYRWKFSRDVKFEGEAFFDVEKGSRFAISSNNGATEILGTSFNIYARQNNYKVFCKTGKVKVSSSKSDVELTILPGEIAILDISLKQGRIENSSAESILAWKENRLVFTSQTIDVVFAEIERQYAISIKSDITNTSNFVYTGNFEKTSSHEEALTLICRTFGLNLNKINNNEYKVY